MDKKGVLSLEEVLKGLLPLLGSVVVRHVSLSELMQAGQQLRRLMCQDVAECHHSIANTRNPLRSTDFRSS